jgi:hypothetical protein
VGAVEVIFPASISDRMITLSGGQVTKRSEAGGDSQFGLLLTVLVTLQSSNSPAPRGGFERATGPVLKSIRNCGALSRAKTVQA